MLARALIRTLFCAGVLLCCSATTVSARQVYWNGTLLVSDWFDPAEWSTGEVPGPGDTVNIIAGGGYTVEIRVPTEPVVISGLVIGNSVGFHGITMETGALEVDGQIELIYPNCFLELVDVTLNCSGTFVNGGTLRLDGSTVNANIDNSFLITEVPINTNASSLLNGSLQMQVNSVLNIGFACTVTDGGFTNNGIIRLTSGGDLYLENGAVFTNSAHGKIVGLGSLNTTGFPTVNYGEVSPGSSTGVLDFNCDVTFASDAVLTIEIDQVAFPKNDRLNVSGNVEIQSATLHVDQLDYSTPAVGDTLTILTGQSVTGAFSSVTGLSLVGDVHLAVRYSPTAVMLVVEPGCCVNLSGNCDGDSEELVDIGDLTALISYLYIPPNPVLVCPEEGNIDGDVEGLIDIGDLTALISYLYIPPNPEPVGCQ